MANATPSTNGSSIQVKRPVGRRNGVSGVDLGRVNAPHLRKVLKEHCKINAAEVDEATDERCTVIARQWFEDNVAEGDQSQCTECGGICGGEGIEVCPYCADGAEEATAPEAKAASKDKAAAETAAKQDASNDEKEEKAMTTQDKAKATTAKAKTKDGQALVQVQKAKSNVASLVTSKTLDDAVAEVKRLKGDSQTAMWDLGGAIRKVYEGKLWSLRLDDKGKQAYRSFESFCVAELGFLPKTALELVDINKHYERDFVANLPPGSKSKLAMAVTLPPAEKAKVDEQIKAGASKREIEKTVRGMKAETGHVRPARDGVDRKPAKGGAATKAKASAKAGEKITVANIVGRQTVRLYKKPATKTYVLKDLSRAKRLADEPFGVHELENGVVQEFAVATNANGELELRISTKRQAE